MKKFLVCMIAAVLAVAGLLTGCGKNEPTDNGGDEMEERRLRELDEDFKYQTAKSEYKIEYGNIVLFGELYEPLAEGKFPAVILSHGYNGHYSDFPAECKRLAERGYICYAFDYCGAQSNGKSTGRTGADYTPFTMKEDLRAVIQNIKSLPYVDETQIFLFGGSQGGFLTALTAADEDIKNQIAAIALYFPAFNIPDDWSSNYPTEASLPAENAVIDFWGYKINGKFVRSIYHYDPFEVIGNYQKDVCIVWGDQDAIVKRQYIDRAVETYGARAKLTVIRGAGHGFGGSALQTAVSTVLQFLEARTYE